MKRYTPDLLSEITGLRLIGATLDVFQAGTTTRATLYAGNDTAGGTVGNPAPNGFAFYIPDGQYDLVAHMVGRSAQALAVDLYDGFEQNRRLEAVENGEPGALGSLRSDLTAPTGAERVSYGARSSASKFAEQPSSIDVGAKGDGATDDAPAIGAVAIPIVFPRQDHLIGEDLAVDVSVEMMPGSRIILPLGVTFTPQAGFRGDPYSQIFAGTAQGRGIVNLRRAYLHEACPEWWGYDAGDGWCSAIEAALTAHPRVHLMARDYGVNRPLVLKPYSRLRGMLGRFGGEGSSTRLLATYPDRTIVQAGPETQPVGSTINDAGFGMEIEDLEISRNVAPVDGSAGLFVGFSLEFSARRITSDASGISFAAALSISARLEHCRAKCSSAGALTSWRGFLAGGESLNGINTNASLTLADCIGSFDLTSDLANGSIHLQLVGKGTDFYQTGKFETVGGSVGTEYDPTGTTEGSSNDVRFNHLVHDQVTAAAFQITGLQNYGRVTVGYLYAGMSPGAGRAVNITAGIGSVVIERGEALMAQSTADFAVYMTNTVGSDINLQVSEATQAFALSNVRNSKFTCVAFSQVKPMAAVFKLADHCSRNTFTAQTMGGVAGNISVAFQSVDATNDYNSFEQTMIGPEASQKAQFINGAESHSVLVGVP